MNNNMKEMIIDQLVVEYGLTKQEATKKLREILKARKHGKR